MTEHNNNATGSDRRVILISGGCGGLGSALAEALARSASNRPLTLILLDRNVRAMEKLAAAIEADSQQTQVVLYPLDLGGAAPNDYVQLADTIATEYGRLDSLLLLAAQFDGLRAQQQTPPHDWLVELQANLGSTQMLLLNLMPLLLQSADGRVVLVSNDPQQVRKAYWGAYGVAQAGIVTLASQWAEELGNTKVRVLHYEPGPMRTKLRSKVWPSVSPEQWPQPELAATAIVDWLQHAAPDNGLQQLSLSKE
jgi:NAD(P)-dependent dehydrogenase (short-subunit alcohol dehydrogenase family)